MKIPLKRSVILALLLLTGCTTVYLPNGQSYLTTAARHIVVNNTGLILDVSTDGLPLTTLQSGQSISIMPHWLVPHTQVSVVAHDAHGHYVGADHYTFKSAQAETWQVNQVDRPRESR